MTEKRLVIQYSLSGMHNCNNYTLVIKNLNHLEANEISSIISRMNRVLRYMNTPITNERLIEHMEKPEEDKE